MADRPEELAGDALWRSAGDRIQTLLDATSVGGTVARERAEQLVREVVELYGAGLARIVATIGDQAGAGMLGHLAADDLVASLLLVHGLHPHDVHRRVSDALDQVRPYLGSHGGDVHLLDIVGDTVQLQFAGSCKSCPSSAVTLELAVEDAIRAAAPEISSIELVTPEAAAAVIPAESLLAPASWCWPAGSATSCTPTVTTARPAMDLWPARRCTDEPRVAIRCCDVLAVTRISTSCTPGRVWMTARSAISIPSRCWCATACCRWRCRLSRSVLRHDQPLRRPNPNHQQPAGTTTCWGAVRDVLRGHRRPTPARGECGWAATNVRMPRLLSAVH
jgi:Fe-S cluster biogenesis protein NfuA